MRYIGSNRIATDKDIIAQDVLTGRRFRFEVKDVSPDSQIRNFTKYKIQIDKMASEHRRTGEKQVWINRREVHPSIARYAKKLGVAVEGNVTTSQNERVLLKNREINMVLAKYSSIVQFQHMARLGMGVYGAYMLVRASPVLYSTWDQFLNIKNKSEADYLRVAQVSAQFGAGAIFTARGLSSALDSLRRTPLGQTILRRLPLGSLGRFAGGLGAALLLADFGIDVVSYYRGHISGREFAFVASSKVSGFAGAVGGAWAGGKGGAALGGAIGSIGGPAGTGVGATIGGTIGSISGGFAGYWSASSLASYAVDSYYDLEDSGARAKQLKFLMTHYRMNDPG